MDLDLGPQTSGVPLPDHTIEWYRTPLDPAVSARLHEKSDARGLAQTLGFLSVLLGAGAGALHFSATPHHGLTLLCVLAYGLVANFLINGMHELGHNNVFKSRALNGLFLRVLSFLGWLHPDMFFSSHIRHHRFTQNPPLDQENPMPIVITLQDFLLFGFVNAKGCGEALAQTLRAALGVYPTGHLGWLPGWEEVCYPQALPQARAPAQRWAQAMLAGHAAVAIASISQGCWLLPFLLSLGPFFNGWLFFLCNATQHVGMKPGAADFRLNTRTFYLHPALSFLYWHMNWHSACLRPKRVCAAVGPSKDSQV
jgi:fatty acid desaturase